MATTTMSRLQPDRPQKRKKEQRTDIWSSLLRQTREAQARSRTQAVQHRSLVLCGGSPEDQRSFVQSVSRPPPSQPSARNQDRKQQKGKGELRLSNKYAYGYGHVTLFSPPPQSGAGVQVLGAEAEEVARVEVHTVPEEREEYVGTLRTLLRKKESVDEANADGEMLNDEEAVEPETRPPGVCILLSWKQPWKFLDQLRRWIQLLAKALLSPEARATDPMDVIKDAQLAVTVVIQHTEAQEELLREGYKEEDFDYISQCLRTALLPLHPLSALVYTTSSAPPQQPGSPLSECQKVIYTSLGLDLASLSPKAPRSGDNPKKDEFGPKHEFMDRMAIIIPAGWDSTAFIRTLSETFAPEDMLGSWLSDLQPLPEPKPVPTQSEQTTDAPSTKQANGGAEVYENSPVDEDLNDNDDETPLSPSKASPSAIRTYSSRISDPQAHKSHRPIPAEVTTKPDQKFLAEMREHLQQLEAQDRERETSSSNRVSNTSLASSRVVGLPSGEQTGALNELGDVSFNVGGVSYDTVTAEAAIERLKRPPPQSVSSPTRSSTSTPKPPKPHRENTSEGTPASASRDPVSGMSARQAAAELPIDKLEEYFQSLMSKGKGGTPTKGKE